jgi:fumarate reductase subunit C
MSRPRAFVRPIAPTWWARSPYLAYTLREATAVLLALYALILLAGVVALAKDENAYNAWLGFLQSKWSLGLHIVIFAGMVFHVWTWFQIMPKTLPRLVIGGRYVPQARITAAGLLVAGASLVICLLLAVWMRP